MNRLKLRCGPAPSFSANRVDEVGQRLFVGFRAGAAERGMRAVDRSTFSRSGRSTVTFQ